MGFEIRIDPSEPAPIWRQIEEGIRRGIAAGALRPGDPVPSVREAAVQLRVNPATVARAYRSLVDAGLLSVRRGEGTFVARGSRTAAGSLRREELSLAAERYVTVAGGLGVSLDEALGAVRRAWPQDGSAGQREEG